MRTQAMFCALVLCIVCAGPTGAAGGMPDVASVEIQTVAPIRIIDVGSSVRVNSNRKYLLDIPREIRRGSLKFTQYAHDQTSDINVRATSDGEIYLCLCNNSPQSLKLEGRWELVGSTVPDPPGDRTLTFYKGAVKKGDFLHMASDPEWGTMVIAKQIELKGAGMVMAPATGETIYNGIRLPANWPPDYRRDPRKPMPVPYLARPPEVIPIDIGRQLFVDDFLIDKTTLGREFHRPEYHEANPVLKPDRPWEYDNGCWFAAPFSGGTWYDPRDNLFKLWYTAGMLRNTALATSRDGVHWDKPVYDVTGGTGLVVPGSWLNDGGRAIDTTTIWIDHDDPDPAKRYKYFATEEGHGGGRFNMVYRTSADGIHWSNPADAKHPIRGDRSTVFYNPFRKVWVLSERIGWGGRARRYCENPDPGKLISETMAGGRRVNWVAADDLDPTHPVEKYARGAQLYNLDVTPYESLMIGQFSVWQGPENGQCDREGLQKRNEILLGFSRDGFHWDRPDRGRFIACTWEDASWRFGNVQSAAPGFLVVGDKLYIYFCGRSRKSAGMYNVGKKRTGHWDADAATGLAILRRDGFASMNADGGAGTLTTRPVTFKGRHLFVNVDCPDGELRAEILGPDGTVIGPFTAPNCRAVAADATLVELAWRRADLLRLAGKPVRLRFHLSSGKLYSFWVSPDRSGASHGYVGGGGPGFTGAVDTVGTKAYE